MKIGSCIHSWKRSYRCMHCVPHTKWCP